MVELKSRFVGGQRDSARHNRGDLVVARDERPILAAANQHSGDAVRLVGGFDEDFLDPSDIVAQRIEGLGTDDFGCVQHDVLLMMRALSPGNDLVMFRHNEMASSGLSPLSAGLIPGQKKMPATGKATGLGRIKLPLIT